MESQIALLNLFITDPRRAFRRMSDSRPMGLAMLVLVMALFSSSVANIVLNAPSAGAIPVKLTIGIIFSVLFKLVSVGAVACLYHFIAGLYGAGGSAKSCFVLMLMTLAPNILLTPFALLFSPLGSTAVFPMSLVYFGLGLVSFILAAIALQENYRMEFGNALVTAFSPIIVGIPVMVLAFSGMVYSLVEAIISLA